MDGESQDQTCNKCGEPATYRVARARLYGEGETPPPVSAAEGPLSCDRHYEQTMREVMAMGKGSVGLSLSR